MKNNIKDNNKKAIIISSLFLLSTDLIFYIINMRTITRNKLNIIIDSTI